MTDPQHTPYPAEPPREIWLQYHDYDPSEGVTWCRDQQHDDDVRYVRDDGWHPASEPPRESGYYLATICHIGPVPYVDRVYFDGYRFYRQSGNTNGGFAAHWRELPDLPEPPHA